MNIIATNSPVTVKGHIAATVLAPDYGTVNEETVLVGYILLDGSGHSFSAPLDCVRLGVHLAWDSATD
jgi:hypothetical protein